MTGDLGSTGHSRSPALRFAESPEGMGAGAIRMPMDPPARYAGERSVYSPPRGIPPLVEYIRALEALGTADQQSLRDALILLVLRACAALRRGGNWEARAAFEYLRLPYWREYVDALYEVVSRSKTWAPARRGAAWWQCDDVTWKLGDSPAGMIRKLRVGAWKRAKSLRVEWDDPDPRYPRLNAAVEAKLRGNRVQTEPLHALEQVEQEEAREWMRAEERKRALDDMRERLPEDKRALFDECRRSGSVAEALERRGLVDETGEPLWDRWSQLVRMVARRSEESEVA